jgi:shikimate kinase
MRRPEVPEVSRRVVLVGMMGSGKSTIGRLLAERTGWPFLDNDALLEGATGLTARDLLATRGEGALRKAEADALRLGLAEPAPVIVAAAAGTIEDEQLRRTLRENGTVVWLRADPHTLAGRARGAAHRPWLGGDAEKWMSDTDARRATIYQEVADLTIDTTGRRPAAVADDILSWLRARSNRAT